MSKTELVAETVELVEKPVCVYIYINPRPAPQGPAKVLSYGTDASVVFKDRGSKVLNMRLVPALIMLSAESLP